MRDFEGATGALSETEEVMDANAIAKMEKRTMIIVAGMFSNHSLSLSKGSIVNMWIQ